MSFKALILYTLIVQSSEGAVIYLLKLFPSNWMVLFLAADTEADTNSNGLKQATAVSRADV